MQFDEIWSAEATPKADKALLAIKVGSIFAAVGARLVRILVCFQGKGTKALPRALDAGILRLFPRPPRFVLAASAMVLARRAPDANAGAMLQTPYCAYRHASAGAAVAALHGIAHLCTRRGFRSYESFRSSTLHDFWDAMSYEIPSACDYEHPSAACVPLL